jgi:hypothetical protein
MVWENGIEYKFKKEAVLLSILGTLGGTYIISQFLGITMDDLRNINIKQLAKIIPAYFLAGLITNNVIARTIGFANPVPGQRITYVDGAWKKRGSRSKGPRRPKGSKGSRRSKTKTRKRSRK